MAKSKKIITGIPFPTTPVVSPEELKEKGKVSVWDGSSLRQPLTNEAADLPLIHYNIIVDSDIIGGVIRELIGSGYHNIEIKKHDLNSHKVFFTLR